MPSCFGGVIHILVVLSLLVGAASGGRVNHVKGFVGVHGTRFILNGSPFLFNGFNAYWMMHVSAEPSEREKVSSVLQQAAAVSMTVARTWAFADGGDRALQISPGIYDERVFQGLDFVISEAKNNGIRLILSLVNNFQDFGGRSQYVQWARNSGIQINGDDDFYRNPVVKGYYKAHVMRVLTRVNTITGVPYREEPTIMAWELMNEPRCESDYSGRTVQGWVEEMAAYVKSLDGNHLLEIGMEGFYGDSMPEKKMNNPGYQVGTDFMSSNMISNVDFATIHAYPDIWLCGENDAAQLAFLEMWISSHWKDSKRILKKPLVFAEFGKSKRDDGYTPAMRDLFLSTIYRNIYTFARRGETIAGGLVWQIMAQGMESYYDGYEIVLSQDPSTQWLISRQSHMMLFLERAMRQAAQAEEKDMLQGALP